MKSITGPMAAHLLEATTTLCSCWKVTRKDGMVLGFTDHDEELVIDDITYVAETGFFRSAITNSATLAVNSLEVRGFLDSASITANDLLNHRYDYAEVEVFAVNWKDLSMGVIRLRYGLFGESIRYPSGLFAIELRGLMQLLQQKVGRTIVPECDADLGDERCGVKLMPDEVMRNAVYTVGERVLVPLLGAGVQRRLPLLNGSFEQAQAGSMAGWEFVNAIVSNAPPYFAADGAAYLMPDGIENTGSAMQEMNENQIGDTTILSSFSFKQYQIAAGWQARGVVEILDAFGDPDPLKQKTSAWTETTVGEWTQRTVDCDDEDVTLGGFQVFIEWRPDPATIPAPDGPAQVLFDDCEISHDGTAEEGAVLLSPSFELTYTNAALEAWGGGFGAVRRLANINFQPYKGEAYLLCSGFDATTQVVIPTDADGVTEGLIDAGEYDIEVRGWVGSEEWGYEREVVLKCFDNVASGTPSANGGLLSILTTGWKEVRPERQWQPFVLRGALAPGTRSVRLELDGRAGPRNTSTAQKVGYDYIFLDLFDSDFGGNPFYTYGGVEFVCIQGGVTAGTQPTFDNTIGAETNDGSVVWECVTPAFSFLGTVTSVTDHTHFTISGAESAVDEWFQFGIVEFLDGDNEGRLIEIKHWTQATGAVEIALPMLWAPTIGDQIKIVAGCDKSREMCHAKFNNIVNFRGFPDVPGTDEYFKVGGVA